MVTEWQNLNGPKCLTLLLEGIRDSAPLEVAPCGSALVLEQSAAVAGWQAAIEMRPQPVGVAGRSYASPGPIPVEAKMAESEAAGQARVPSGPERVELNFEAYADSRGLAELARIAPTQPEWACVARKVVLFVPPPIRNHACRIRDGEVRATLPVFAWAAKEQVLPGVAGVHENQVEPGILGWQHPVDLDRVSVPAQLGRVQSVAPERRVPRLSGPRLMVRLPIVEQP